MHAMLLTFSPIRYTCLFLLNTSGKAQVPSKDKSDLVAKMLVGGQPSGAGTAL